MIIAVCDPKGIAIEAIKTILYHDKGLSDRISRIYEFWNMEQLLDASRDSSFDCIVFPNYCNSHNSVVCSLSCGYNRFPLVEHDPRYTLIVRDILYWETARSLWTQYLKAIPGKEEKVKRAIRGILADYEKEERDIIYLESKNHCVLVHLDGMFDRLGRIESETPFVLEWFVQHGIEMWSTHEGQQKIETHGDKLMNYIRFWQAAGESEKTSIRTRDRIRQIVSSGHYTGGFVCYGYQLVDQGRRNKRDKPVMDLVINEEEATWVRELFYKVIQEGTSGYALAEMLNNRGLRTRAGAKFQSSNIIRIIRHEGYTGYIITKNARSEYIKELQIIDRETFDKANDIINRRKAKSEQERKIAHTSQNPTLLAGIVYCAHCGAKMSGFMHTDRYKLADGSIREKVQPKYNCFQRGQRNKGGRDCDGQALYLAERVDAIVLKIVEEVFEQIRDTPYSQVAENRIRQESNLQKTKRAAAEKKIKAAQHALERFEGEILKCLDGTSNFTEDMIAKQIRRYQQELDDAKAEYAELQNARLNEAAEIRKLRTYYDDFKGWAEEFDTAPLEMKRMILSHLIDRVEVGRKYQVIVKFNMKYRQFLECTAETYNTEIGA